jgi:hypothetical protein
VRDSWKRNARGVDLESELRKNRPEPRRDFVHALSSGIRGVPERRGSRGSLRLAFVGGLTVVMLAAVGSMGGIAQAASAVKAVVSTVTGTGNVTVINNSPAYDQYGVKCNSGRGNLSETESGPRSTDSDTLINPHLGNTALGPGDFPTDDCDPGNSGPQNRGGD